MNPSEEKTLHTSQTTKHQREIKKSLKTRGEKREKLNLKKKIKFIACFSSETIQARMQWSNTFKVLKEKKNTVNNLRYDNNSTQNGIKKSKCIIVRFLSDT